MRRHFRSSAEYAFRGTISSAAFLARASILAAAFLRASSESLLLRTAAKVGSQRWLFSLASTYAFTPVGELGRSPPVKKFVQCAAEASAVAPYRAMPVSAI